MHYHHLRSASTFSRSATIVKWSPTWHSKASILLSVSTIQLGSGSSLSCTTSLLNTGCSVTSSHGRAWVLFKHPLEPPRTLAGQKQQKSLHSRRILLVCETDLIECILLLLGIVWHASGLSRGTSVRPIKWKCLTTCRLAFGYDACGKFMSTRKKEITFAAFWSFTLSSLTCSLRRAYLTHAPTPSWGPFPYPVS